MSMNPTAYDMLVSMLIREAKNGLGKLGLRNNALVDMAMGAAEDFANRSTWLKDFVEKHVLKNSATVDASAELIKEDLSAKIDSFGDRLKQKLEQDQMEKK